MDLALLDQLALDDALLRSTLAYLLPLGLVLGIVAGLRARRLLQGVAAGLALAGAPALALWMSRLGALLDRYYLPGDRWADVIWWAAALGAATLALLLVVLTSADHPGRGRSRESASEVVPVVEVGARGVSGEGQVEADHEGAQDSP